MRHEPIPLHIFTVAKDRLRRRLGTLTESSIQRVNEAIKISLALD